MSRDASVYAVQCSTPLFGDSLKEHMEIATMIYQFARGSFIEAGHKLAALYEEYDELLPLSGLEAEVKKQQKSQQIQAVELLAFNKFRNLCVPNSLFFESKDQAARQVRYRNSLQEKFLNEVVRNSGMPVEKIAKFEHLHQQSQKITDIYTRLIQRLEHQAWISLDLHTDHAVLLADGLSVPCKNKLLEAFKPLCEQLDTTDPLNYALKAFLRIVFAEDTTWLQEDKKILEAYQDLKQTYPALSRHLTEILLERLKLTSTVAELNVLGAYAGSYQQQLLTYQSEGSLSLLREALSLCVQGLFHNPHSNGLECITLWQAHANMAKVLQNLPGESLFHFRKQLLKLQKKACSLVVRYLGDGSDSCFYLMRHYVPSDQVNQLYRSVLFLNTFGDADAQQYLKDLLARLVARQHKAMMTLTTDAVTQNFVHIVHDLVKLGYPSPLVARQQTLMDLWLKASTGNVSAHNALIVRQRILEHALEAYQQHFCKMMQKQLQKDYVFCDVEIFETLLQAMQADNVEIMNYDQTWIALKRVIPANAGAAVCDPKQLQGLCLGVSMALHLRTACQVWRNRIMRDPVQTLYFAPEEMVNVALRYAQQLCKEWGRGHSRLIRYSTTLINELSDYVIQWPQHIRGK